VIDVYYREDIVRPFFFEGGDTGILLIHGFTACPIDMKPLGETFRDWGYTVSAPLLPGHGRTPEEFSHTSWKDWLGEAERALKDLGEICTKVVCVGHSMGGLIALALAAKQKIDAVISINAPIVYRDPELHKAYFLLERQEFVDKPHKNSELTVTREGLPHFSYAKVPVKCFVSLNQAISTVRKELGKIQCPALIVQSLEDQTIHPSSGEIIEAGILHPNKEVIFWAKEDHYLPLSPAREKLAQRIRGFIERYDLLSAEADQE